jgi:hypothetical protein
LHEARDRETISTIASGGEEEAKMTRRTPSGHVTFSQGRVQMKSRRRSENRRRIGARRRRSKKKQKKGREQR